MFESFAWFVENLNFAKISSWTADIAMFEFVNFKFELFLYAISKQFTKFENFGSIWFCFCVIFEYHEIDDLLFLIS